MSDTSKFVRIGNYKMLSKASPLSKLLCVSVLTGLYNYELSLIVGLDYYQKSDGDYPITLGPKGRELLLKNKEVPRVLDICEKVTNCYQLSDESDFKNSFKEMHTIAVVMKYVESVDVNELGLLLGK